MEAMPRLFVADRDLRGPRIAAATLLALLDHAGARRAGDANAEEDPGFDDALWDVLAAYAISSAPWRGAPPVHPSALPRPLDAAPDTSLLAVGLRLRSRATEVDMRRPSFATLRQFHRGIVVGDSPENPFRVHELATALPDGSVMRLPAPSDVKGIVKRLFSRYDAGNRGVAAAFALGIAVVAVHPFVDGNGRTTRSLVYRLLRDLRGPSAAALNIAFFFQASGRFWRAAYPRLLRGNFDEFDALVATASAGARSISGDMRVAQRRFNELLAARHGAAPAPSCGAAMPESGGRACASDEVSGRKSVTPDFLWEACAGNGDLPTKRTGFVDPAAIGAMDVMTPSIFKVLN
jgi:hypothetical protein